MTIYPGNPLRELRLSAILITAVGYFITGSSAAIEGLAD